MTDDAVRLYLDLLKKCVGNFIYDDDLDLLRGRFDLDPASGRCYFGQGAPVEAAMKYAGQIWPSRAHTMIGMPRLDNLQACLEEVLRLKIPGDVIETDVWRGGATIFMRGILKAYGVTDRRVWVADSFAGLPPGNAALYPKENPDPYYLAQDLAVSIDEVKLNFARYGLLDEQVWFLQGWFRDTLPAAPIEKLALLRLDGDLYESTMDALVHLYHKLSPGGMIIVDDYGVVSSCNAAVDDFRREQGVSEQMFPIPGSGAWWRKGA